MLLVSVHNMNIGQKWLFNLGPKEITFKDVLTERRRVDEISDGRLLTQMLDKVVYHRFVVRCVSGRPGSWCSLGLEVRGHGQRFPRGTGVSADDPDSARRPFLKANGKKTTELTLACCVRNEPDQRVQRFRLKARGRLGCQVRV